MAYQARQRDPLFDSETQAVIERRGKELLGLGLLVVAVAVALMLGSYVPEDPSWLSATDEPARNLLGRFGASIASPLFVIVGWGAWAIVAVFGAWGLRFLLHVGEERAPARLIFAPLAIALVSVYASTHVPAGEWTHSFGLGGLFGDTVLGAVLGIVPVQATLGLKMIAAVVAAVALVMSLFVLGCSKQELRLTAAFLLGGVVMSYAGLVSMLGRGAHGVVRGSAAGARAAAEAHQRRRDERAQRRAEADDSLIEDDEPVAQARPVLRAQRPDEVEDNELDLFDYDDAPARGGVLSRLSGLFRRRTEPQDDDLLEEPAVLEPEDDGTDDRIRAKIADVIKARVRARPILTAAARPEPPVQRPRHPRGPQPMILPKTPRPEPAAPAAQFEELVHYDEPQEEAFDEGFDPETLEMPESELVQPEPSSQSLTAEPLFETGRRTAAFAGPAVERKKVQHPPKKVVQPSRRAQAEAQPALGFDESDSDYEHPPLNLLTNPAEIERHHLSDEALEENARMLETVLDDYGVKGEIVSVRPGPVVTMYELEPAPGLKASRVIGLADDIARSMSALSARVSTVPGRSVIGIELPNSSREKVVLREILSARDFGDSQMKLPLALGKDIGGEAVVANLAKMPHLLIAGTTGSGKSVAINTMILSLLYKLTPEECRLIMIDPKMLELSVYDGIPHLLSPVVTDPKKAVVALKWVVAEMEDRYRKMSRMGVRNIEGFNGRVKDALSKGEMFKRTVQTGFDDETGDPVFETEEFAPEALPYIVVIVDEMADLMMVAGKEIEACIQRLAQMARASGIHLIMATQRPSVDVITGTIKANFPTRISFQVTSKIDSRTILGEQGAEQLLGMGDMLYMAGGARLTRVHGPFVSDEEVEDIVNYLKQFGPPDYVGGVVEGPDDEKEADIDAVLGLGTGGNTDGEDALYDQAVAIVIKDRKCSTSYIQRKLAIGYNKAARLVEQMEDQGVVSSANHVGKREILVPEQA
ncbi:DNA translocase FtsK [Tranquillimonas alkanivorans]|uniref:DNA translocase FtsK n=1 Tax=Tranquillimonas alkanivorans TaxID=441119 RepID=A0A1I5L8Y1_9RHOB|nr:DNA translocase FtsK [Tranquillimonas alkanivorans]SFO93819.1 DNA translocase FtsK [Tranquillimonas alkanivorans]